MLSEGIAIDKFNHDSGAQNHLRSVVNNPLEGDTGNVNPTS